MTHLSLKMPILEKSYHTAGRQAAVSATHLDTTSCVSLKHYKKESLLSASQAEFLLSVTLGRGHKSSHASFPN